MVRRSSSTVAQAQWWVVSTERSCVARQPRLLAGRDQRLVQALYTGGILAGGVLRLGQAAHDGP
jgi:hypothetical protein